MFLKLTYYINNLSPGGPIPHNMARPLIGPPTLERSGSEHRVGRFPSSRLRREDRDERWNSPWKERRRGSKITNHKASPYKLFQSLFVIILKPVLQSLLKAPLKLIPAVLQLLTTDISRNLEFLHSRRTDTHW